MKVMVQGTSSGAGKTTMVCALCRIFSDAGYRTAPFKAQNMSRFSYRGRGLEISRAQAVQARAARARPSQDMNPILLKPRGDSTSEVFAMGRSLGAMDAAQYYRFAAERGMGIVRASLRRLASENEALVIEGAGSPAEINIHDIANMATARAARAPVLLVSDMERGGAFASVAGTLALLPARDRARVRGLVMNRFRGDRKILEPGLRRISRITGVPVLGVVPSIRVGLPEEDSLGSGGRAARTARGLERSIDGLAKAVKGSADVGAVMELAR